MKLEGLEEKSQQESFLLNSMRKLVYVNDKGFTPEQRGEISYIKLLISDNLNALRHNQDINRNDFIEIQNTVNRYSKYIIKNYKII